MKLTIKSSDATNTKTSIQYECLQLNYIVATRKFIIPVHSENGFEEALCPIQVEPINILLTNHGAEITFDSSKDLTLFGEWLEKTDKLAREAMKKWLVKVI